MLDFVEDDADDGIEADVREADVREADVGEDGLEVEVGEDGLEADVGEDGLEVEVGEDGLEVDVREDGLEVEVGEDGLEVVREVREGAVREDKRLFISDFCLDLSTLDDALFILDSSSEEPCIINFFLELSVIILYIMNIIYILVILY
jgi:hypothetical protein